MQKYVAYYRVSSEDQGRSGLGLEAQRRDISVFLDSFADLPFEVIGEFTEIQSGKDADRPQLALALDMVRSENAELLIAKLDRLSRKVSFIAPLMDDKRIKLRVASMPQADKFQLHLYAALAEQERDFISARTKAALAAAKDRGVKLGGLRDKTNRRNEAAKAQAQKRASFVFKIVKPMRENGSTFRQIADALNEANVATARGGKWGPSLVKYTLDRLSA